MLKKRYTSRKSLADKPLMTEVPAVVASSPLSAATSSSLHIAVIMDGNGRWAKERGLPRIAGHKKGGEVLRAIVRSAGDMGISHLTVYAFSSENWKRPQTEISDLMELLSIYLKREIKELRENGIRLRFIGDRRRLSSDIVTLVEQAERDTEANTRFCLIIALSYGAREELARAVRKLAHATATGALSPDAITEEMLGNALDTSGIPEPDLLIRTGGDQRLSNFLLWQSAYTELYFTPVLWPDFTPAHLQEAINDFTRRERRYGNTH